MLDMLKLISGFFGGFFGAAFVLLVALALLLPGAWLYAAFAAAAVGAVLPWHRRWVRSQASRGR